MRSGHRLRGQDAPLRRNPAAGQRGGPGRTGAQPRCAGPARELAQQQGRAQVCRAGPRRQ
ncbi:MAG: hypothetical protein MZW92_34400 [Comamonadaceae bacterium]|nr:hypothetical protein [Comamonadaceae bacterium]